MPLWRSTVKTVRAWLRFNPNLLPASALLPNRNGHSMTRTNVAQRLAGSEVFVGLRHIIASASPSAACSGCASLACAPSCAGSDSNRHSAYHP